MEVVASAKYVRRAPRKARQVADLVRGLRVEDALAALQFTPKHAGIDVAKVIKSAAANAEHNNDLVRDELFVKSIEVNEAARMRRFRPGGRYSSNPYTHRTSHITVVVEDRPEPVRPTRRHSRPKKEAKEREEVAAGNEAAEGVE
jgi:large subunit ribosomal protein L22